MRNQKIFKKIDQLPPTIGARIFVGFGLVVALLVMQSAIGTVGFDDTADGFRRFKQINNHASRIMEIERNVLALQQNVMAYTQTGYEGVISRVHQLTQTLRGQLDGIQATMDDAKSRDILRRMAGHFESYSEHFTMATEDRRQRDRLMEEQLQGNIADISASLTGLVSRSMERNDLMSASLAGIAQEKFLLIHQETLNFLNTPRSIHVSNVRKHVSKLEEVLRKLTDHLRYHHYFDDSRRVLDLMEIAPRHERSFMEMVQITRGYLNLVYVVMAGEAWEFAYLARELKKFTTANRDAVQREMSATISDAQAMGLAVSLLATILSLLFAWLITRNIAEPVKSMTRTLTDLARGVKDADIPGRGRRDELGSMAKAAQVFKEKADELENASRYKSEFLANMSHELRTPLNSMLILSKMFAANEEANLTKSQVESAEVIHASGTDLLRLINDILDLSKVEAGRMELLPSTMELRDFLTNVERLFAPVAHDRGLEFVVDMAADTPAGLKSDWSKVEQIIRNFLSNAFKFTVAGEVRVRIHKPQGGVNFFRSDLEARNAVAITVQDTGIGIPQDKQEQIFEAFRQADGTTSRKYGGTGLGLSISRKFSELLGGEIQVESREGEGAAFSLYLPLHFPAALDGRPQEGSAESGAQADRPEDRSGSDYRDMTRTILVVDDDKRNIFAIRQVLKNRVGHILTAADGLEALEVLTRHADSVDLVLMDIMMPAMDGFQAMQAIRSQSRFRKLPLLALTAKVMPGDREKCMQAGASDYIPKPVDGAQLLAALADWLGKPKTPSVDMPRTESQPHAGGVRQEAGSAVTDEASVEPLLGGRKVTVMIVDDDMRSVFSLTRYLQKLGAKVVMAHDGVKAMSQLEEHSDIDLILMDLMMPNQDGLETTRRIRENRRFQDLPIMALTAKTKADDQKSCLEAGMDDYLAKPVELDELRKKIEELLATEGADQ